MNPNAKQNPALERTEPTAGVVAVPIWIILACMGLVYWAAVFLDEHSGGFSAEVFEPYTSVAELAALQPSDPHGKKLAIGADIFNRVCAACHQPNGMGKEGQFPPLAGSDWLLAAGPNRIGRIVINGLSGSITVNANGGPVHLMAAMAVPGEFSDEQIAAVLTYLRQRKDWNNNASEVTADQIKAIRAAAAKSGHAGPWTPDELQKLPVEVPPN